MGSGASRSGSVSAPAVGEAEGGPGPGGQTREIHRRESSVGPVSLKGNACDITFILACNVMCRYPKYYEIGGRWISNHFFTV